METDELQKHHAELLTADYMDGTRALFSADPVQVEAACLQLLWHFKYQDHFQFGELRTAFRAQLSHEAARPQSQYEWLCCGFLTGLDTVQQRG